MKKNQTGFTLIELAIVLVIIGLLLGGVLKGQDLINSAKGKNMIADFKNAQIFIYAYQDRYRALPGDDVGAVNHLGDNATAGNGDGLIAGPWNSNAPDAEATLFWQHVRLAGLATGPTVVGTGDYYPRNSEGGRIGVQSMSGFNQITTLQNTGTYVVCSQSISGKLTKQIDITLDDGVTNAGNVQAVAGTDGGAGVAVASINDGSPYTVCMSF